MYVNGKIKMIHPLSNGFSMEAKIRFGNLIKHDFIIY
jgi:hypothetical protein